MKAIMKIIKSNTGSIFLEVLISMVLVSMLLMTFMSMFVISARVNRSSLDVMDATYTAQNMMEELYELSIGNTIETTIDDLQDNILTDSNYEETIEGEKILTGQFEDLNIMITIKEQEDNDLTYALVEVYSDDTYTLQDAVMQSTFLWHTEPEQNGTDPGDPNDPEEPEDAIKIVNCYISNSSSHGNKRSFFVNFILNNGELHMHNELLNVQINQPIEYYFDGLIDTEDGTIIDYRLKITVTNSGQILPSIDNQQTH